ncbi:Epidermal growth factor receptor [Eumeta japonica]|uniref:Epidermal growth factor receptor n=1 Tax=Eumeta variegata TaxID=151549 RepID=A0A4C1SWH8_EUMVA|nr:Epidermal growth factor receptor [Eumeta japonica]
MFLRYLLHFIILLAFGCRNEAFIQTVGECLCRIRSRSWSVPCHSWRQVYKASSYTSQDEKDLIRKLAPTFEGSEPIVEADDYLQPKSSPGTHNHDGTDDVPKLNRYCKDPMNKTSSNESDETDSNAREAGIGDLRLDLPVDEDDYLMPTCQIPPQNLLNNNNNNMSTNNAMSSAHGGYMDLIGVPASVDNPEYLLNPTANQNSQDV